MAKEQHKSIRNPKHFSSEPTYIMVPERALDVSIVRYKRIGNRFVNLQVVDEIVVENEKNLVHLFVREKVITLRLKSTNDLDKHNSGVTHLFFPDYNRVDVNSLPDSPTIEPMNLEVR